MKRNMLFGSILATALTVGLGAQAPTQSPSTPAPGQAGSAAGAGSMSEPPRSQSRDQDQMTVTGCLKAGDEKGTPSATGTTGSTADKSSKPDDFVLTDVSPGASAGAATAGTTGSSASQFKLSGKKDELRPLVNSKVEIRGKVEHAPSAGTATTGASSNTGTTGSAASTGSRTQDNKISGQTLKVDSVRQIAASCS
jgi:hypothetical protein